MNVWRPPPLVPSCVRAIIFDLDGTLVDSYPAITLALNHARSGFDLEPLGLDEVRRAVGHGLPSLVGRLIGPDRVEDGVRSFTEAYERALLPGTRLLPGTARTLVGLKDRGYSLAVASNKPLRFTERILDHLGIRPLMAATEGPESAGATKPDPAMIRACLVGLGVPRRQAVYVGDMTLDVESAARAGVAAIVVAGGSSTIDELRSTGELVLDSLTQLLDLLPARAPEPS